MEKSHITPMPDHLQPADAEIAHHMAGRVYAKQFQLKAGMVVCQHRHNYDHLSLLPLGTVRVTVDGVPTVYTGPDGIEIKAGKEHMIEALTDSLWYCVHQVPADLAVEQAEEILVMEAAAK